MVSRNRHDGVEVPPETVAEITRLYESGLYVQATARAEAFGPVVQWRGTAARLIGGRIANNVYAPRLSRWLHGRAWRDDKKSPEAAYYNALTVQHTRGPLAAWRFLRGLPTFADASPEERADLLTIQATILGTFRDFDSANKLVEEATQLDAQRPWLWVERGSLHEQQDAYEEALAATRHALELHPWFRPAVQASAHQLQLLGRDDEALALLQDASQRLECAAIANQLAVLQDELGLHAAALESWQRVRELAPWMEPKVVEWWDGRMSDAYYFTGRLAESADAASRVKNHFYEKLVDRLRTPAPDARRVLLKVGFVRQHHFTCAPATLSALSHYWNMPVDHLALAAAICYDGTPDHVERHWAEENGWHAREFRVTWEALVALLDRGVPFTLTTVETQSAHLQAVIGYDSFRGTILIRDPYARTHGEWLGTEFLERYAASGPRGMLLLPPGELSRLEGIELPDAALYDDYYALQRALHSYDREEGQRRLLALETAAPEHRLTLLAQRTVAGYDGSLTRQLEAVERLLSHYPKNGNYLWGKLSLLRQLSRRADYQDFLRQWCAEKDSEPLFWREWAGELSTDARRFGDAERLLERALHYAPTDPDNLQARANLLWERRDFVAATELYRLAASLRDKVDLYSRSYFIAARHLRQTETALALLAHRFEKFGRQSSQPLRLLFWALGVLDRQPEAFEKLDLALAHRPDDGELLLFAADALARHGDHERGAKLLESAEKRTSRVTWLRTAAGLADYRCDLRAALVLWREVLTEEPLAMDAQRAVTRLLAETEGRAAALSHLEDTCQRFEHHIGLHELWAEWARQESNTAVEPVLRRLLALHPEYAWAHRELASVCSALHRPDEAAAALDVAEQLEPQSPSTPGIRAQVALEAGRLAEAREHARAALRLSIDYDYSIRTLLAASDTFEEKKAAIAFVREELIRQVVFGDGLIAFRTVAYDIVEPPELLANLREAQRERPDLWHAWSALTQQLLDMKELDEALALARETTERFPLLPRIWLELAHVHLARRERELEIPPLKRALQLSPAWGRASRQLADTHQRMGNYAEAARVLEQAIAAAPLDPLNYGCLADVFLHLQRTEDAVARLEHALKLEPDYDWAWDMLRNWSPEQGENNRALLLARKLTTLRAGEARSWFRLAQVLPAEPLAERLEALDRATTLNPRFGEAHDFRATSLAEAGRFDEAIAACAPAAYGDQPPTMLRGRGAWVEARRGNTRAAIAHMQAIVAESPDYYWGWNMLADWCAFNRDFTGAMEAARKMARLAPRSAIPLGYLADIQLQDGQENAAYESLRQAYEIDPTYAFAGFALFDRHLKEGETAEAAQLLEKLVTHLPGARTQAAAVRLHARLDRRQEALETLKGMLRIPDADGPSLHTAVNAMVGARWGLDVENCLAAVLEYPGVNAEVGSIWVQRCVARDGWKSCKRLFHIAPQSELGCRARVAYIEAVAEGGHTHRLRRLVSRERVALRANITLWGTIGYAYVHLRDWREAERWMRDAERRVGVKPWMLLNLCTALREMGRDEQALTVNRRALALTRDHATVQHQLWVAFEAGLAGDLATVDRELAEIREHALGDYEQKLLTLIKGLQAVYAAPISDRPRVAKDQRGVIAGGVRRGDFRGAVLDRARRRCIASISKAAGDRWGWLRSRMPNWGAGRPFLESSPQKSGSVIALIALVVISAMVRTCTQEIDRPILEPRAFTPIPFRTSSPRPVGFKEPINIQLAPPESTPLPLLLQPAAR